MAKNKGIILSENTMLQIDDMCKVIAGVQTGNLSETMSGFSTLPLLYCDEEPPKPVQETVCRLVILKCY